MRVHSPASVAASSSPTRALSRVDLPALTLPAIATRNGSSRRRRARTSRGSRVSASARSSRTRTWSRRFTVSRRQSFEAAALLGQLGGAGLALVGRQLGDLADRGGGRRGAALDRLGAGGELVAQEPLGAAGRLAAGPAGMEPPA